ncbi:MAG: hypothetical protein ABI441_08115 [Flavobacterium sp.]
MMERDQWMIRRELRRYFKLLTMTGRYSHNILQHLLYMHEKSFLGD